MAGRPRNYRSLWEFRPPRTTGLELFQINLRKDREKVEDGKIYELFSYLLNNLIFRFFLKEERD